MDYNIDYKEIRAESLRHADSLLNHFLPNGKKEGYEYVALNPTRRDSGLGSFKINTQTGLWSDFATGAKGGDLISLIAHVHRCEQHEAAQMIADLIGMPVSEGNAGKTGNNRTKVKAMQYAAPRPILPIPEHAPPPPDHPNLGKPVQRWEYRNEQGQLLKYNCRFEVSGGGKDFRPQRYDGSKWQWSDFPAGQRPLYRLDQIEAQPQAPVMLCEGEKAADAANRLFPEHVVTTTGSATSVDSADLSPLAGRAVRVWRDADDPGLRWQDKLLAKLAGHVSNIELADIDSIATATGVMELEAGYDAADFEAAGLSSDIIRFVEVSTEKVSSEGETAPNTRRFSLQTVSAADLLQTKYESPRWAIEPILPEGLTVLAGAPKLGKSWMALDIALSVSSGNDTLGNYAVTKGKVLYLALEDSYQRLQKRLLTITDEGTALDNLSLCNDIPKMDDGGIAALETWCIEQPDCRLIIVDTLSRFTPKPAGRVNAYERDYPVLVRLQCLAMERRIALVVITHVRKGKAPDEIEEVTGSMAITGAADAIWILKRARGEQSGVLTVTGRDIEEQHLAAEFDKDNCRWTLAGDAAQEKRHKDLAQLRARFGTQSFTYSMVEDALEVSKTQAKRIVQSLHDSHLKQVGKLGKALRFQIIDEQASDRPTVQNRPDSRGRMNEATDKRLAPIVQPSNETARICGEV